MVEVMRTYLYGPSSALQKKERGQTHHHHHHAHTTEAAENSSVSWAKYCRKLTGIQHLDVGFGKSLQRSRNQKRLDKDHDQRLWWPSPPEVREERELTGHCCWWFVPIANLSHSRTWAREQCIHDQWRRTHWDWRQPSWVGRHICQVWAKQRIFQPQDRQAQWKVVQSHSWLSKKSQSMNTGQLLVRRSFLLPVSFRAWHWWESVTSAGKCLEYRMQNRLWMVPPRLRLVCIKTEVVQLPPLRPELQCMKSASLLPCFHVGLPHTREKLRSA